jgi:hypothetical protein
LDRKGHDRYMEVAWASLPRDWQSERAKMSGPPALFRQRQLELLECTHIEGGKAGGIDDAWIMRQDFLRLNEDTTDLVKFLNKWGAWKPNVNYAKTLVPVPGMFSLRQHPDKSYEGKDYVLPSSIWQFQERCRNALMGRAIDWLSSPDSLPQLSSRHKYPHFCWSVGDCEGAIRTTITIDFLNRVKFGVCARPDCRTPFPISSRHKRKYCEQYCGHLESVRRNRRTE